MIQLVGGSPEDTEEASEKEPVKPMYPATPLNKIKAEPAYVNLLFDCYFILVCISVPCMYIC